MKIVIIVSYTYPYIGSGIGQVALKQAEYLTKNGNNVILISSNIPKSKEKFYKNRVLHIKQKSTDVLERISIPVPLFVFNAEALKAIKKTDIVHVHDIMYPSSFLAAILTKIYKKRLFVSVHITHVSYSNKLLNLIEIITRNTMGFFILACAEKIIIINKSFQKDQLLKKFKHKLVYLPNGVDLELFKPINSKERKILRAKYNLPINKPIVLFVGRFVQKKGYRLMLDIQSKKYLVILIGDTKNEIKLQKTEQLMVLGKMKQDKLADYYKMSNVFVLPSHGEGFPLSIQEAMASGIPVITTKQNIPLSENDNLAFFIKIYKNDISKKIEQVFSDKKRETVIKNNALNFIQSSFSWEKNINSLNFFYEKN